MSTEDTIPSEAIVVVFDGPPAHQSGRFIEVEDASGASINAGEWKERGNGLWELRIELPKPRAVTPAERREELAAKAGYSTYMYAAQNVKTLIARVVDLEQAAARP